MLAARLDTKQRQLVAAEAWPLVALRPLRAELWFAERQAVTGETASACCRGLDGRLDPARMPTAGSSLAGAGDPGRRARAALAPPGLLQLPAAARRSLLRMVGAAQQHHAGAAPGGARAAQRAGEDDLRADWPRSRAPLRAWQRRHVPLQPRSERIGTATAAGVAASRRRRRRPCRQPGRRCRWQWRAEGMRFRPSGARGTTLLCAAAMLSMRPGTSAAQSRSIGADLRAAGRPGCHAACRG